MVDWLTDAPGAETQHVVFPSGSATLHGLLYTPGGNRPHPSVALFHGFPGWENNGDIAYALARVGWAVFVPHYHGNWGMPGDWSWAHAIEDAAAATDLLGDHEFAERYNLDPAQVAVAGNSLGGFLALMTAAARPGIASVASIAGFDFGAAAEQFRASPETRNAYVDLWHEDTAVLSGTNGEALISEIEAAGDAWSLRALAPRLRDRRVLLVAGERDTVAPPDVHHEPLVRALRSAGGAPTTQVLDTTHSFTDQRLALTALLVDFLGTPAR